MTILRSAALVLAISSLVTCAYGAIQFSFNTGMLPNPTSGSIDASGTAQNYGQQEFDSFTTKGSLTANYQQPSGLYSFGNDSTAAAGAINLAGSGDAFLTYGGDGTNSINIRFSADGLASGTPQNVNPPLYAGGGAVSGNGHVGFNFFTGMTGLTPGKDYVLQYTWDVDAAAGLPINYAGGSSTSGKLQVVGFSGHPPLDIFNVLPTDVTPTEPPIHFKPSGSGSLHFVALNVPAGVPQLFNAVLQATSGAGFSGSHIPPPERNDLVGATFFGEATFTLLTAAPLHGDWNRDGVVDQFDIPVMLNALTDLNAYKANFNVSADDLSVLGDTNGDGRVNNLDLQGLLTILKSAGAGGLAAVPEPASIVIFSAGGIALMAVVYRRKRAKSN